MSSYDAALMAQQYFRSISGMFSLFWKQMAAVDMIILRQENDIVVGTLSDSGILPELFVSRWSDIDIPSENVCL